MAQGCALLKICTDEWHIIWVVRPFLQGTNARGQLTHRRGGRPSLSQATSATKQRTPTYAAYLSGVELVQTQPLHVGAEVDLCPLLLCFAKCIQQRAFQPLGLACTARAIH